MNYEFKGTPGPWEVGFAVDHNAVAVWPRIKHPDENGYSDTICLISPELDVTETDTNNSNLIASAPDLLEALKAVLDFPEVDLKEWADGDGNVTITLQPCHIKQALDAIHKALNINQ